MILGRSRSGFFAASKTRTNSFDSSSGSHSGHGWVTLRLQVHHVFLSVNGETDTMKTDSRNDANNEERHERKPKARWERMQKTDVNVS